MVLLRCLPLLAISALPVSMSAALNTPPSLNLVAPSDTMNITQPSLEAPSEHLANITRPLWPSAPFKIKLHPRFSSPYLIVISRDIYQGSWPLKVPRLQDFLREFRDNLVAKYPVPGFLPPVARQSTVDVESYSRWTIEYSESFWTKRLPTEVAVCALDEIARLTGRYGPATLFFSVQDGLSSLGFGLLNIEQI